MDFSKLNQNERMAAIGAAVTIVAGLVGFSYSVTILGILFAVGLLVVIFLPMLSPTTRLPGSKGSLMLITGGTSAVLMVLSLLVSIEIVFTNFVIRDLFFLIAVAGAVVAAWFSWQQFQSEGGRFQVGATPTPSAAPPAQQPGPPAPAEQPTAPPPAAPVDSTAPPPSAPAAPPPPSAPVDSGTYPPPTPADDEDRSRNA